MGKYSKTYSILTIVAYVLTDKVERNCIYDSNYVTDFIAKNYGEASVNDGITVLLNIMQQNRILYKTGREDPIYNDLRKSGKSFSDSPYEERMRLLAFFIGLALEKWGYNGVDNEMEKLRNVAMLLGLEECELDILVGMLYPFSEGSPKENALRVLGLHVDATDEEIRTSYRQLTLKYHPDRNLDKSQEERNEAERKFKEVVAAKETLDHLNYGWSVLT